MNGFTNPSFVERWSRLSLAEQLGNIGSEVDRVIRWREAQNEDLATKSLYRALDLIDLTIADKRWNGGKRRELTRMREVLCDLFVGDNEYNTPPDYLSTYFFQFAAMARRDRRDTV